MILLVHGDIPGSYEWQPKYTRLVSYNRLDEVPKLLLSVAPNGLRSGITSTRQQRPYIEVVTRVQPNSDHDGQGQRRRVEMLQEKTADRTEVEVDIPGRDHEQKVEEIRDSLKYVLECLVVIKAFAESEREEAMRRMMTPGSKNIQELMEALDQHRCDAVYCTSYQRSNKSTSKLLKKAIELQKKIYPSSKFHQERSVSDLRLAVLEVKAIVESLDNIPGSIEMKNWIKKCWATGFLRNRGVERKEGMR